MENIEGLLQKLSAQSLQQSQQIMALTEDEARNTTAFSIELNRLQTERAFDNNLRKQMVDMLSDVMRGLKKTGDETRQSN
jgi:hypothetical protein